MIITTRNSFLGRTDAYANRRSLRTNSSLEEALRDGRPYDVTGISFGDDVRDNVHNRHNAYDYNNRFYKGYQWINPLSDGERKPVFNFVSTIVDKAVCWTEGKGWRVEATQGNEAVADYLNYAWRGNNRASISLKTTHAGAIKGDSYVYVTLRSKDAYGKDLPRDKWTVRIQTLSPEHVIPIWSDVEVGKMRACMVQYTIAHGATLKLYTIWITPERIKTYIGDVLNEDIENPLKEVTVVHIPNFEPHDSVYGESDIEDVIPLNIAYNSAALAVQETLRYHAEPTTIIYGARASSLEKGSKSVWSNMPKDGKVENLQVQGELTASNQYLELLFTQICQISSTPKVAFDSFDVRVTSSSAAAFELMFQPLVEKTRRRQVALSSSLREVNRLIILVESVLIKRYDLEWASDDLHEVVNDTGINYTTPLPRDEGTLLDIGIKKMNSGVLSRAELVRQCSGVANHERLILELIADKRAALVEVFEKQKALQGERPTGASVFLDSVALMSEVEALQQEIAIAEGLTASKTP